MEHESDHSPVEPTDADTLPKSDATSPATPVPSDECPPIPAEAVVGALTEDRVREELKKVIDPELFVNIVDLGLIYVIAFEPAEDQQKVKIEIREGEAQITLQSSRPNPQVDAA